MSSGSDSWKQMFRFTKDGKLQSITFMYAFFLGIGVLFLNFLISNRAAIWFESWFSGASRSVLNLLGVLVPAILSAALSVPVFLLIKKKRIVLLGYWFTFLFAVILLIAVAVMYDAEVRDIMLLPFAGIFLVPAALEAAVVTLLFVLWRKRNPVPVLEEQKRLEEDKSAGSV